MFRFSCRCKRGPVIKIWYIKRSLQVEMCFHLVGQASRSKYPIGSGPSFAICVFPAIDFEVFNPTRVLCFRACVEQVSKVGSCFVSPVGVECFQPSSVLAFVSLCRRFESTISQSVLVSCRRLASSVLCRRLANVLNVGYCFVDLSGGLRVEDSTFRSCSVSPVGVECF